MSALRKPVHALMTVDEFHAWEPPANPDRRWQLIDGIPVAMAPASDNHGTIQSRVAQLLANHLDARRPGCRVVTAPGVVPRVRSATNRRIPDLGVTCAPPTGSLVMTDPLVLIEILSPSNESQTRANIWTYSTIPSVAEILLVESTRIAAELWRRDPADGSWPSEPSMISAGGTVSLPSLAFSAPLTRFYRGTSLLGTDGQPVAE